MGQWVFIILCVMSASAWSAPLKLETQFGRIYVPEQKGWELGRDMFGMPFIFFSPQVNGQRSNISFTNTGVDLEISLGVMSKNPDGYKKVKLEWSEEVNATPQSYLPYKRWQNEHGHAVHEIGFEYLHEGKAYVEKSYYIDCRGRLVYAKSLRLKVNAQHDKEFLDLIKEADCAL